MLAVCWNCGGPLLDEIVVTLVRVGGLERNTTRRCCGGTCARKAVVVWRKERSATRC